jgi:hypothetical protein
VLGILFLAVCVAWGVLVATRLPTRIATAGLLGVGAAFGLALALWLPLLLGLPFGTAGGSSLALAAAAALLAFEFARNRAGASSVRERAGAALQALRRGGRSAGVLVALVLAALLFGRLFYTHSLEPKADGLYSAGNAWGDTAFHATLANHFLHGPGLSLLQYPVFAGWPLGYPFAPDYLAAALSSLGLTLSQSLWLSGWLAALALCVLVYALARAWLRGEARGTALAVLALLLLSGGLGFAYFLGDVAAGKDPSALIAQRDHTDSEALGLKYTNFVVSLLLPARTALFGLALSLAALLLLTHAVDGKLKDRRALAAAGLLAGALPLVHVHSFFALAFAGGAYAVLFRREGWRPWAWFFVPLAALALPQLAWSAQQVAAAGGAGFVRVHLGWMSEGGALDRLVWWLRNAGVFLLLVPLGWAAADGRLRRLAAPFLALFLIGNVVAFQPYAYDNIKFFVYAHIAGGVLAALFLQKAWSRAGPWRWAALALLLTATASGALTIAREAQLSWLLVDSEGARFAEDVRAATPPGAVLLTGSDHNHPVTMLAGRRVLLGYKGWLWTHAINYAAREREVNAAYSGDRGALARLGAGYLVVGPNERREFGGGLAEGALAADLPLAARRGPYALYRIE